MKNHLPPRLAEKLFTWYCGLASVEDLSGDMHEWFLITIKTKGVRKANWLYWKQTLSLIFSYAITKRRRDSASGPYHSHLFSISMISNYIKVGFRNIARHKYFSTVNIIGLSIGMSVGLLLIAMYTNVKSFDSFQKNRNSIYRVISHRTEGVESNDYASTPHVLGEKIAHELSSVKAVIPINSSFAGDVMFERESVPLSGYYTDSNFLSVFTYEMLLGDQSSALTKPNSLVLTESAAEKLFGTGTALGKTVELQDLGHFEVTGIMKDPPRTSHLEFEALCSFSTLSPSIRTDQGNPQQWTDYRNQYVYVLIPDPSDIPAVDQFLINISSQAYAKESNIHATFSLEPLIEITPGPELRNSIGPQWEMSGFIMFAGISLLILLPACFNYTNISIARALKRSKEIGLRKTLGGQKNQIFFQFITETVIITLISLIGGVAMFMMMRNEFHSMLVESASLDLSLTIESLSYFLLFAIITGMTAGIVPALYFSRMNPIQALKSQGTGKVLSGIRVRKALVVFQFFLSLCFIIALVGFSKQYYYSLHYNFGFEKENILDVELRGVNQETFVSEFSRMNAVQSIALSSGIPGVAYSTSWMQVTDNKDSVDVAQLFIDHKFIRNFGLKLIAGKNFPEAPGSNERYIIINEEFLKEQKIASAAEAIGKIYSIEQKDLEIIGVVKNFHYSSLQLPIKSFYFRNNLQHFNYAHITGVFTDPHSIIAGMEDVWKRLSPDRKFEAHFFNDEIDEAYDFYNGILKIFGVLGILAISISLLGLLGMVVYTSENKTKEVGIRKVMGASTFSITMLLSKDYFRLILWAALFAIPFTNFFFEKFAANIQYYHITLSVWDLVLSFLILIVLGLGTIASQTIKTASTNPADTLKYE